MRMCVVYRGCAVRRPAGVGNAGQALQTAVVCIDLLGQFCHPGRATRSLQTGGLTELLGQAIDRDTARVIATVLQSLQALHQHRNNVAG